jgi:hypothetical protein
LEETKLADKQLGILVTSIPFYVKTLLKNFHQVRLEQYRGGAGPKTFISGSFFCPVRIRGVCMEFIGHFSTRASSASMGCKANVSTSTASTVLASSSQRDRRSSQISPVPRTQTFRGPIPTL